MHERLINDKRMLFELSTINWMLFVEHYDACSPPLCLPGDLYDIRRGIERWSMEMVSSFFGELRGSRTQCQIGSTNYLLNSEAFTSSKCDGDCDFIVFLNLRINNIYWYPKGKTRLKKLIGISHITPHKLF